MEKRVFKPTRGMNNATYLKSNEEFELIQNLEPEGDLLVPMSTLAEVSNDTYNVISSDFQSISKAVVWKPMFKHKDMVADTGGYLDMKVLLVFGKATGKSKLNVYIISGEEKKLTRVQNSFIDELEFTSKSVPVFFISPRRVLVADGVLEPFFITIDSYGSLFASWIRLDSPLLKPRVTNNLFDETLDFVKMETTGLSTIPANIGIGIESGQVLQYVYTIKTERYEESSPSPIFTFSANQKQYKQFIEDGIEPFIYWLSHHQLANLNAIDDEARYISVYRREIKYTEDTFISGDFRLCAEIPVSGDGTITATMSEPAIGTSIQRANYPVRGAKHICESGGSIFVSSNMSELFVVGEFEKYIRVRLRNQNTRGYVNANVKLRIQDDHPDYQDLINAIMPASLLDYCHQFSPYIRAFDADRTTPLPLLFHYDEGFTLQAEASFDVDTNTDELIATLPYTDSMPNIEYEFPCVDVSETTNYNGTYKIKRIIQQVGISTTVVLHYDGNNAGVQLGRFDMDTEAERKGLWLITTVPYIGTNSFHDIFILYNTNLDSNPLPEEWQIDGSYWTEEDWTLPEIYERLRYGVPINLYFIKNLGNIYINTAQVNDDNLLELPQYLAMEVFGLSPSRVRDHNLIISCSDEEGLTGYDTGWSEWQDDVHYFVGDIVKYAASFYICIQNNIDTLPTDPSYWEGTSEPAFTYDEESNYIRNNSDNSERGRGEFYGNAKFLREYLDGDGNYLFAFSNQEAFNSFNKIHQTGSPHIENEGRKLFFNSNVLQLGESIYCFNENNSVNSAFVRFYDDFYHGMNQTGYVSMFLCPRGKSAPDDDCGSFFFEARANSNNYFRIGISNGFTEYGNTWLEDNDLYACLVLRCRFGGTTQDIITPLFLWFDSSYEYDTGLYPIHILFTWSGRNCKIYINGKLLHEAAVTNRFWIRDEYRYQYYVRNDRLHGSGTQALEDIIVSQLNVSDGIFVTTEQKAQAIMNNTSLYDTQHLGYVPVPDDLKGDNVNVIIDTSREVRPEALYNTTSFIAYSDVGERGFASRTLIQVNDDIKALLPAPSFLKEKYENTILVLARNSVHRVVKGDTGAFEGILEGVNLGCVGDMAWTQFGEAVFWMSDNGLVRFAPDGLNVISINRMNLPQDKLVQLCTCIKKNQIFIFTNTTTALAKESYVYNINYDTFCKYYYNLTMIGISQNEEELICFTADKIYRYPVATKINTNLKLVKYIIDHYFDLINLEYHSTDYNAECDVDVTIKNPLHETSVSKKQYADKEPLEIINIPKGFYGTEAIIEIIPKNTAIGFDNFLATIAKRLKRR